jgi:hypothetical protein
MDAVQSGHARLDPNAFIEAMNNTLVGWDARKNYENILEMRREFPGPVMDVESHYEDTNDGFNTKKPFWNASDVRHGNWPAIFSGACGVTYGNLPVQQSYAPLSQVASPKQYVTPQLNLGVNTSWYEGIHRPGAAQTGYTWKLFKGLSREAFKSMTPARQYVSGVEGGPDVLKFEGERYTAAIITEGHYWVYSAWGDAFQVDLGAVSANWEQFDVKISAQWFDPRTSVLTPIGEFDDTHALGKKAFVPPSNGGIDHDWILVLEAVVKC